MTSPAPAAAAMPSRHQDELAGSRLCNTVVLGARGMSYPPVACLACARLARMQL
jgi:hypothetical protein